MRIKEFAKQIGVSPTTISQAITGNGRVSPATRQMVLRRMEELGYIPNPHAQQLVTGRSHTVALHHTNQDILSDLFLIELTHGVQLALHRRGYGLLLDMASDFRKEDYPLRRWLVTRAVDGVILVKGWSPVEEWVQRFASPRSPIVVYGDGKEAGLPHVGTLQLDNLSAIQQAIKLLLDLGHRRIGYIGLREPDYTVLALRQYMEEWGVALPDDRVVCPGFTAVDGARAIRMLLSHPKPPTAVFCRKDDLAIGALNAAVQMGVRVPDQLSLIGHDDVPLAAVMDPPLTTVRLDCEEMGAAAVQLLFDLLENPEARPEPIVTKARLVMRSSVARPADRS